MQKIKAGKAPGHDKLTSEMLKFLNETYKKVFLSMINQIKKGKQVPKDWISGIIIIIIFKTGDSKECKNYRGITLTSTAGKLYTRILETRLRKALETTMEDSQDHIGIYDTTKV